MKSAPGAYRFTPITVADYMEFPSSVYTNSKAPRLKALRRDHDRTHTFSLTLTPRLSASQSPGYFARDWTSAQEYRRMHTHATIATNKLSDSQNLRFTHGNILKQLRTCQLLRGVSGGGGSLKQTISSKYTNRKRCIYTYIYMIQSYIAYKGSIVYTWML